MILSAAMMLDWLGTKHDISQMMTDAAKIRTAVDTAVATKSNVTADLGGLANTTQAAHAIQVAVK
jgi:3-isopropylmalate dehydrogenase